MSCPVFNVVGVAAVALISAAGIASAQTLFPEAHRATSQSLDVSGSALSSLDGGGWTVPEVNTAIAYSKRLERLTFDVGAATVARRDAHYTVTSGIALKPSRRVTFSSQAGLTVAPYFAYTPFSDTPATGFPALAPEDSRYVALRARMHSSAVGANAMVALGERALLTIGSTVRRTASSDGTLAFGETGATSQLRRQLARHTDLRVGYAYRDGSHRTQADNRSMRTHDVEVGIDRTWRRSPSRHTAVSGTVGPTMIDYDGQTFYRVAGRGDVSHQLSKTWSTGLAYQRGLESMTTTGHASFADALSGRLTGRLHDRLRFDLTAGGSMGHVGFEAGDTRTSRYSASSRLAFSLRSGMALYAEYFVYGLRFGTDVPLPDSHERVVNRRGPRVGFTFAIPLARRGAL
jgi:hypothetical protein